MNWQPCGGHYNTGARIHTSQSDWHHATRRYETVAVDTTGLGSSGQHPVYFDTMSSQLAETVGYHAVYWGLHSSCCLAVIFPMVGDRILWYWFGNGLGETPHRV